MALGFTQGRQRWEAPVQPRHLSTGWWLEHDPGWQVVLVGKNSADVGEIDGPTVGVGICTVCNGLS